jgi:hypothetical protein
MTHAKLRELGAYGRVETAKAKNNIGASESCHRLGCGPEEPAGFVTTPAVESKDYPRLWIGTEHASGLSSGQERIGVTDQYRAYKMVTITDRNGFDITNKVITAKVAIYLSASVDKDLATWQGRKMAT